MDRSQINRVEEIKNTLESVMHEMFFLEAELLQDSQDGLPNELYDAWRCLGDAHRSLLVFLRKSDLA